MLIFEISSVHSVYIVCMNPAYIDRLISPRNLPMFIYSSK